MSALALALLVVGGGTIAGTALGAWIVPSAMAFMKGGWGAVSQFPTTGWLFPSLPPISEGAEALWMTTGSSLLGMLGLGVSGVSSYRLWRHMVVNVFGLMTDAEVDEFDKRDPGF